MYNYKVSAEYLESVTENLLEFADHPESWIVAQFLEKEKIGWKQFKSLMSIDEALHNAFEVTISKLCAKWLKRGLFSEKNTRLQEQLIMRYVRLYDNHGMDVEVMSKLIPEEATEPEERRVETYEDAPLDPLYAKIYAANKEKKDNLPSLEESS